MGVDLGSSNIKSVVFDPFGNVAGYAIINTPIDQKTNNNEEWIYYHPEKIWENVLIAIKKASKMVDGNIACIAVTGMGMDSVPLDKTGEPLYPFISWRCQRGHDIFQSASDRFGLEQLYRITGQLPRYLNSVIRYLWLRENEPDLYKQTRQWLTIEDYINYKLCGVMATDYSMASTTLLCGIDRKWSETLLDFFNIDKKLMPEILPSSTVLGKINADVALQAGIDPKTLIVLGGHDYHCGAVSCGGFDDKKLVMSMGTYECLIASVPVADPTDATLSRGMSYEGHVIPDRFSLATGMIEGGVLDWWESCFESHHVKGRDFSSMKEKWDSIFTQIADLHIRMSNPLFMPHLYGCDAPENDPDSKGAFIGLTAGTTKAAMLLALVEGVNFLSFSLVQSMEKALGSKFQTIHAIGSIVKNRFIMQQKADIMGSTIWADTENTESVCLGAALLAGVGAGIYKDLADAYGHLNYTLLEFAPNPEKHALYTERYHLFQQIYKALAPLHKSMSHNV